jgi:hypothetical protein
MEFHQPQGYSEFVRVITGFEQAFARRRGFMAQSPIQRTTTKEFDQRLRCIIKEHWMGFEPPSEVWETIHSRLESKTAEKTMPLVHAFPSVAVVRVLSSHDPGDPTTLPKTTFT